MKRLLDFLEALQEFATAMLPRFVTDWVGCMEDADGIAYPVYPMQIWNVQEDGIPDCVCRIKSFQVLGWSVCGKAIGTPVTYQEWMSGRAGQ